MSPSIMSLASLAMVYGLRTPTESTFEPAWRRLRGGSDDSGGDVLGSLKTKQVTGRLTCEEITENFHRKRQHMGRRGAQRATAAPSNRSGRLTMAAAPPPLRARTPSRPRGWRCASREHTSPRSHPLRALNPLTPLTPFTSLHLLGPPHP